MPENENRVVCGGSIAVSPDDLSEEMKVRLGLVKAPGARRQPAVRDGAVVDYRRQHYAVSDEEFCRTHGDFRTEPGVAWHGNDEAAARARAESIRGRVLFDTREHLRPLSPKWIDGPRGYFSAPLTLSPSLYGTRNVWEWQAPPGIVDSIDSWLTRLWTLFGFIVGASLLVAGVQIVSLATGSSLFRTPILGPLLVAAVVGLAFIVIKLAKKLGG